MPPETSRAADSRCPLPGDENVVRRPQPGDYAIYDWQLVEIVACDELFVSVRYPGEAESVTLLRSVLLFPDSLRHS